MGSKWKTSFLTDHYIISSGLSKPAKDFGTGYPFLSFKDIFYNYFLPDSLTQLVQSTDKERATCSVRRGDVFLTRTSETMHELGMSSVALKDYADATFNGFCKRLRPKESSELEPEYVGYYLRSPIFRQGMLAFSTMSTRASLNNEMISRLEISYPDRKTQKKIANTLLSLDKKIALSRAINQTLEQMSQTLFKSWFVDFDPVIDNVLDAGNSIPEALQSRAKLRQKVRNSADFKPLPADIRALFPAEFEETELGWIPKGWKISTAGDELVVKGGSTPSTSNADFWENGTIHWTSPKDLTGNDSKVLLDTSKKITEFGLKKISSGLLPTDTVLMSSRAPIGYLALAKTPMAINQGYIAIPSSKNLSPEYIIYWLENIMDDIKGMAGGTTFAEISKSAFKTINLVIPSKNIIDEFTRLAHQHFEKVVSNTQQITALTTLRDTLLPKLISGELSLEDLPNLAAQTEPA
ncbi:MULTISPECIES: restriction endonuclease subunit S [Citrobacter freundii complex]|uniref:restriction endonuclease subunit S n=1 Tax=Citrobacter freundii complex TaxID=1344959 RepID=UPI000EF18BA9|nr:MULTISPECIES: restriction endonuclease subunit S [Citrobacter]AYL68980.1 restriction endonuclease subunit S [Citrobacter werkmanii]MBJ8403833.1 restriction endonuclease subunit S [Citrobacter cronae]MBU5386236.1 restriction endonuclease subunit S [Citrobacter cronae]MDE9719566.1 restriction endonuclease subunit S [Citrobacter cronae]HCD7425423.1 restriction endonuclease subunit S [Citrobacter werkmanii]